MPLGGQLTTQFWQTVQGKVNCKCSSSFPGLIKMKTTQERLSGDLCGKQGFYYDLCRWRFSKNSQSTKIDFVRPTSLCRILHTFWLCKCSSSSPGLIKMRATQQSLFSELSRNRNYYYDLCPGRFSKNRFYTLFDFAVCFVFCNSEIGLVEAQNWLAVWAPGCFLTLLIGFQ